MWPLLFWLFLSAGALVETALFLGQWGWLNRLGRNVPAELASLLPEGYGWWRGVTYARERLRVSLGLLLTRYAAVALAVGAGGLKAACRLAGAVSGSPFLAGFLLGAILTTAFALVELPWGVYGTFGVEARFGFNRSSPGLYLRDAFLKTALSSGLAGFLLGGASFLLGRPGGLPLALSGTAVFDVAAAFLLPRLVLPLFFRLRPLEEGTLKSRLESLFQRTGFSASSLQIADGSRRSTHGNAFFAGLGRSRRVILFDTLAERFPPGEAAAVVAHEIGHWKKRHVPAGLLHLFALQASLVLFAWFAWRAGGFSESFGLPGRPEAFAVMAYLVWGAMAGLLFQPLLSSASRCREFEADRYAAKQEGPDAMIGALARLATDSLAWTPSEPRYAAWYSSHPSVAERILALKDLKAAGLSGK